MITSFFIVKYIQMMRDIIFLRFLYLLIHGTTGRRVVTNSLVTEDTTKVFTDNYLFTALDMKFMNI